MIWLPIKELFEFAIDNHYVDLQALIMFLVFEKQVLTMEDDEKELDLYHLAKHKERMTREMMNYKRKMKMNYKPKVFEITTADHTYNRIYILAMHKKQAESFCYQNLYKPIGIRLCDDDMLMTQEIKGKEVNLTIMQIINKAKKIPSFLGGY